MSKIRHTPRAERYKTAKRIVICIGLGYSADEGYMPDILEKEVFGFDQVTCWTWESDGRLKISLGDIEHVAQLRQSRAKLTKKEVEDFESTVWSDGSKVQMTGRF